MTDKEALKLALEALMYASYEDIEYDETCAAKVLAARDAIKEALAQPKQEPVAWADHGVVNWIADKQFKHASLLYTTPPKRKPLTLGQKQRLWSSVGDKPTLKDRVNAYGLAIEAAHGIKE